MRISDWSSDVCSSDLPAPGDARTGAGSGAERERIVAVLGKRTRAPVEFLGQAAFGGSKQHLLFRKPGGGVHLEPESVQPADRLASTGSASCRERVCQYV